MSVVPARLIPLLAQLDSSLAIALERMRGMGDDEFFWQPSVGAATVKRGDDARLHPVATSDDRPRTRTIALLIGHLGEMAILRGDFTDGEHRLTHQDLDWPASATEGEAFLSDSWGRWRSALAGVPEAELDLIGRCSWPLGLDLKVPIVDIAWWMNRELIHHTAEIAFVRDLYATSR